MKKFLVVDDVKGWRDFNSNILLELFGNDIYIDKADCAKDAYEFIIQNNASPYDAVITDLQMEEDYMPKYAGEWLVEQIKTFNSFSVTKIVIISASYNARHIAENLCVDCIPKATALKCFSAYEEILGRK